jgi:hypothetical protein
MFYRTLATMLLLAGTAYAADPATDAGSLLSPAAISKALGQTYSAPEKSVAPRPFPNTNQGTDCFFKSGGHQLWLRVYVDPSPAASTELFARLKQFYGAGSTDVSGLGDEAYLDKQQAIHVRKGKVRYYINQSESTPTREQNVKTLATQVAGQL